jgi:hypothetical protein
MNTRSTFVFALLMGLFTVVSANNLSGVWKGRVTDPQGQTHDFVFKFKANGNTFSGTVLGFPPRGSEHNILNAKVYPDHLSFEIVRNRPGGAQDSVRFTFAATAAVDELSGSVIMPDGTKIPLTIARVPVDAYESAVQARAPQASNLAPPHPQGNDPVLQDAQTAILAAFDTCEVVAIGSVAHGTKDLDDFIFALVRNPSFPDKVNDVAVEGGNALYQPILDRYIAGEEIPLSEAQQVWRNTTQTTFGLSLFYEEFFPLIRRINKKLPSEKKIRVLACDSPIDWSKVRSSDDLKPFRARDEYIAEIMEKQVFAKHRKALMLFGINHIRHGTNAVRMYESQYPNRTLVIADHHGFGGLTSFAKYNDDLEKRLATWPSRTLVIIKGSWLANLESFYFDPDYEERDSWGYPGADCYLYLGPRDLLLREFISASAVLDKGYMNELRRRAAATGMPTGPQHPDSILQNETESSVFMEDNSIKKR